MRRLSALLAFVVVHGLAHGQAGPLFTRLQVPGIEGAEVRSAVLDRFGALWLGTERGIHRFDGSRTEHYLNDPLDSLSLNDDVVFRAYAGPDGAIWAATFAGVWRIDPFNGERRRLAMTHRDGVQGTYECLGLAWSADGTLWAFCNRSGLARMRPGEDRLSALGLPEAQVVLGGLVGPDGAVWYTDRDALVRYDPVSGVMEPHRFRYKGEPGPPKTLLLRVLPDADDTGALWCTTWGLGFVRFSIARAEFDRQLVHRQPLNDLQNIVTGAVPRGDGTWWVLIDEQLVAVDPRTGALGALEGEPEAVMQRKVGLDLLSDGTLCLGGVGAAALWAPAPALLTPVAPDTLSRNTHVAPAVGGDGYWLVRFYADRELIHAGPDGRVLIKVPLPAEDRPYEAFKVSQGSDGSVWLASTYGLLRHRPGTAGIAPVPLDRAGVPRPRPYVTAVHEQPAGVLWAALQTEGLVRWRIADDLGERYIPPPGREGAPSRVSGIGCYDERRLLVNLLPDGPALFDMAQGVFEPVAGPRLPVEHFRAAAEVAADATGRIYVLTRSHGIMRLRRSPEGPWELERRWLPPDRPWFEGFAFDARGRLWVMATNGIHLLDPATDILHRLDALHGFTPVRIAALAAGLEGEVLVHAEGWHRVRRDFEPRYREPQLLLRSVMAGRERMGIDALLSGRAELPSAANDVHIGFGVVALVEGDAFTYRYRISRDGDQGAWADLGRERAFSLLDLRPGAYLVELRAESPSALPASLAMRFTVLPPWWATWWARSAAVVLAVLTVMLLTRGFLQRRYRARVRELERERELEKVRMRIARDIHDGIGSGLTKITMLSRQMDTAAAPQAARIAEASTELVSELGEIVWTVDPRNDSFASFIAYVRNMLGRQFEDLSVDLKADLRCAEHDRERTIGPEHKRNILLVLKEAVSNALRHSGASRIEVKLDLHAGGAELLVRDDGHGFDPRRIREGANGLANFSKRAEALDGTVSVDTGGSGTTITLRVPLPSTNM